jgi:hypothetical protein
VKNNELALLLKGPVFLLLKTRLQYHQDVPNP